MNSKIILQDAFKTYTLDLDKVVSPEETLENFRKRTRDLNIKLLKKTERIDNRRLDIPVFFSECGHDAKAVIGTNKQMGKGATPGQSEASAVMELVERYSFFSFMNHPDHFITDTYHNVKEKAMPFSMILKSVNDEGGDEEIKKKIFGTLPLKWTRGYNLTRKREVLIPFDWFYTINEFNGPSAGNCNEEAICQGICEVVERHTSALVSHGRLKVPGIDPDSADDPMVKEMVAKYRNAGINLYISDFTLDMGIPTVGVMAYDPSTFPVLSEIVWTAGTAPDPEKALSRALTETAQLAGDFNTNANYVASGLPKLKTPEEADFIMNPDTTVAIDTLPDISDENIKIEIERTLQALFENKMEVFIINTMNRDLGIPAFYTIIPGAHFRERAVDPSVGMFSARLITERFPPLLAVEKLDEIEEMIPGKYYTQFYKGLMYNKMNDHESAVRCFEKAMAMDPARLNTPDICSHMGVSLKELEQYEKALEVLSMGEEIDNQRTDIHNLKGFCYFKLKSHEKAVESFKKVIEIDPGSAIDYANIATNYRDMGEFDTAVTYYSMALNIDPSLDFARENLDKLEQSGSNRKNNI